MAQLALAERHRGPRLERDPEPLAEGSLARRGQRLAIALTQPCRSRVAQREATNASRLRGDREHRTERAREFAERRVAPSHRVLLPPGNAAAGALQAERFVGRRPLV